MPLHQNDPLKTCAASQALRKRTRDSYVWAMREKRARTYIDGRGARGRWERVEEWRGEWVSS